MGESISETLAKEFFKNNLKDYMESARNIEFIETHEQDMDKQVDKQIKQ